MLEVLIAVLILSFGLLGMLGMMLNSMKFTTTSNYRTIATLLAYSMADTAKSDLYNLTSYNSPSGSAVGACLTTAGCAASDLVKTEASIWSQRLQAALPSGAGTICQDSSPTDGTPTNWACSGGANDPFVIKVCWDESRAGVSSAAYECIQTSL